MVNTRPVLPETCMFPLPNYCIVRMGSHQNGPVFGWRSGAVGRASDLYDQRGRGFEFSWAHGVKTMGKFLSK